jgi:hypothetical protein
MFPPSFTPLQGCQVSHPLTAGKLILTGMWNYPSSSYVHHTPFSELCMIDTESINLWWVYAP